MKRIMRWNCTQWCNFSCGYCRQDHSRRQTYLGSPGHWADNAPVEKWVDAIRRHGFDFLYITGGEPMLDRKNMAPLLDRLSFLEHVKIDTNGDFRPWAPPDNVVLIVSYHPDMLPLGDMIRKARGLRDAGWRVLYVSIVAVPGEMDDLLRSRGLLRDHGFMANVILMDGQADHYSAEELDILRPMIPEPDRFFREGGDTAGMMCPYPSLAYDVRPDGTLSVGCHPHLRGSIFDEALPAPFEGRAPCPHSHCGCMERYGYNFADPDVPAMVSYVKRLAELPLI